MKHLYRITALIIGGPLLVLGLLVASLYVIAALPLYLLGEALQAVGYDVDPLDIAIFESEPGDVFGFFMHPAKWLVKKANMAAP